MFRGERTQLQGGRVGQAQPHLNGVSVLQRERRSRAFILRRLHRLSMALPQPEQHAFDVLAGSQRVDGEVRTGTEILEQSRATHCDTVRFPASGFDRVIAVWTTRGPLHNLERSACCPVPPFGDLLFD